MKNHMFLYIVMRAVWLGMTVMAILSYFHTPMDDFSATWLADVIGSKVECAIFATFAWAIHKALKSDYFTQETDCREA